MQVWRLLGTVSVAASLAACNFASSTTQADGGVDASQSASTALLSGSTLLETFGDVGVGTKSAPSSVVVTNTGSSPSGPLAVTLSGADATSFGLEGDTCSGTTLVPGAACSVPTHFLPTSTGAKAATLLVNGDPGGAVHVSLAGNGVQPSSVAFSAASQAFGTVATGAKSAATTFTLTNPGGTATGKITVALSGPDAAEFALSNDGCSGSPLAVGAKCTVDATFAPASVGAKTATLQASDAAGGSASAALTGTGATPAAFSLAPPSYDFGSLTVGTPSAAQTFTVTNAGGVPSGVPSVAVSGTNGADFALSSACTSALPPGGTCTFTATFTPSAAGAEGPATVTVSAPSTASATTTVTGTGLAPAAITITPGTQSFGTLAWSATGSDLPFQVKNTGGTATGPLTVALSGTYAGQFALGASSDCAGKQLAAGTGTCTVYVHFAPASPAVGAVQASLDVSGTPGGTTAATLSGDAEPPAALAFDAGSYSFGSPTVNTPSSPVTLTVKNGGGVASGVPGAPVLGGTNAGDFAVVTNNCTAAVPGGGSCTMSVVFTPKTAAAESATIALTATPGGTTTATLQGNGLSAAALAITPNPGNGFAQTTVTKTSPPVTFTVTNSGQTDSTTLSAPTFSGGQASDFALVAGTNTCTGTLAKNGGTCSFQVTFTPKTATTETTTLGISDASGHSATDTLSGVGLTKPALAITPNPGNTFPSTVQGATSAPVTFTVKNTGQTDTGTMGAPTFAGGTNPADFVYVAASSTCTVIAKNGGTCTFQVTFKPTTVGTETTTVTISDGAAGDSASDALTGVGLQPTPSIGLSVGSYSFGGVLANPNTPPSKTFTVTNSGTAATAPLALQNVAAPFAIPASTDHCTGVSVPKGGGTCTFAVTFDPTAAGGYADTLTVFDSSTDSKTLALTGDGTCAGACVVLAPNPEDFGTVSAPSSKTVTMTATNYGGAAAPTVVGMNEGGNFPYFTGALGSCNNVALPAYGAAGNSCSFTVTFTPPAGSHGTVNQPNYEFVSLNSATGAQVAMAWLYFAW